MKTGGDLVRERALKFLYMKLKTESKELLNKEGEIHLFEEIKACTFEVSSCVHLALKIGWRFSHEKTHSFEDKDIKACTLHLKFISYL